VKRLSAELQEASKLSLAVAMPVDPDAIIRRTLSSGAAMDIEREAIARGKAIEAAAKQGAAATERYTSEMSRHFEKAMHSMARDLTNVIFQGGKFWDVMAGLGKRTAAGAAQSALEAQLKRVTGWIGKIVADSGIASKALGALFGIGASAGVSAATSAAGSAAGSAAAGAAGSVAGGVAAAGGGAGSAAAGVASGAASGITGVVGAVGAVGTMISSIISNFQMAGMNKSLDLIEKETRYAQIHLRNILENSNKWWPFMKDCHDRLKQVVDTGVGVYNQPGDQGIRIAPGSLPSVSTKSSTLDSSVKTLPEAVAKSATTALAKSASEMVASGLKRIEQADAWFQNTFGGKDSKVASLIEKLSSGQLSPVAAGGTVNVNISNCTFGSGVTTQQVSQLFSKAVQELRIKGQL